MDKKRLNVMLPAHMVEQLDEVAKDMGLNRTSMLTVIVKHYLDQQQALSVVDKIKMLEKAIQEGANIDKKNLANMDFGL